MRILPLWLRLGLAPVLVCIWTLLRIAILGEHPGWPYEMFVPLVVGSSLWLGQSSGYVTAILSSSTAAWAFVPPAFSFAALNDPVELVGFWVSLIINVFIVWMIEQLRFLTARQESTTVEMTDTLQHLYKALSQYSTQSEEIDHRIRNDLQTIMLQLSLQRANQARWTTASDDACKAMDS